MSTPLIEGLEARVRNTRLWMLLYYTVGSGLFGLGLIFGLDALDNSGTRPQRSTDLLAIFFLLSAVLGMLLGLAAAWILRLAIHRHVRRTLLDNLLLPQLFDRQVAEASPQEEGSGDLNLPLGRRRHMLLVRLDSIARRWVSITAGLGQAALPLSVRILRLFSILLAASLPLVAFLTGQIQLLLALGGLVGFWLSLEGLQGNAVRQVILEVLRASSSAKYY